MHQRSANQSVRSVRKLAACGLALSLLLGVSACSGGGSTGGGSQSDGAGAGGDGNVGEELDQRYTGGGSNGGGASSVPHIVHFPPGGDPELDKVSNVTDFR